MGCAINQLDADLTRAFKPDPSAAERESKLREQIAEASRIHAEKFAAMSETEQMLDIFAPRLSYVYGNDFDGKMSKEEIARKLMTETFGPKFTERVLRNPRYRRILDIE